MDAHSRRPQTFAVSHAATSGFETGLRTYAAYRDFGFAKPTDGLVQAHVIRFIPPCRPEEVAKLHTHDVEFQMVYVLKGWIVTEMEGHGIIRMETGSTWLQPPMIRHKVLDYSDDCEVLEVILPAEFETTMLE
jgi:mannose-6-phosphate isomerase-like protein (cupin superfamily)